MREEAFSHAWRQVTVCVGGSEEEASFSVETVPIRGSLLCFLMHEVF
jgi:hypothetical protein